MKTINALVLHVNDDHPEHVDVVFKLAVEYRQKFQRDVMIDVVGLHERAITVDPAGIDRRSQDRNGQRMAPET